MQLVKKFVRVEINCCGKCESADSGEQRNNVGQDLISLSPNKYVSTDQQSFTLSKYLRDRFLYQIFIVDHTG